MKQWIFLLIILALLVSGCTTSGFIDCNDKCYRINAEKCMPLGTRDTACAKQVLIGNTTVADYCFEKCIGVKE